MAWVQGTGKGALSVYYIMQLRSCWGKLGGLGPKLNLLLVIKGKAPIPFPHCPLTCVPTATRFTHSLATRAAPTPVAQTPQAPPGRRAAAALVGGARVCASIKITTRANHKSQSTNRFVNAHPCTLQCPGPAPPGRRAAAALVELPAPWGPHYQHQSISPAMQSTYNVRERLHPCNAPTPPPCTPAPGLPLPEGERPQHWWELAPREASDAPHDIEAVPGTRLVFDHRSLRARKPSVRFRNTINAQGPRGRWGCVVWGAS